eukprot:1157758-Pelagomonas_calceolata.AAC.8
MSHELLENYCVLPALTIQNRSFQESAFEEGAVQFRSASKMPFMAESYLKKHKYHVLLVSDVRRKAARGQSRLSNISGTPRGTLTPD